MFRKFDPTKMENDIKVRQVYQKYKTLNELTRKLYAEIGEKVTGEAPNPKNPKARKPGINEEV